MHTIENPKKERIIFICGILLIAATLRAPISGVGPLLDIISKDLQLSNSAAGLLTTLPVLTFSIISMLAKYTKRLGIERTLFLALGAILVGILLRSYGSTTTLYSGTIILSAGIGLGNVLLPSVVKRDFSNHIGMMTTIYITWMIIVSSLASGIAVPVADFFTLHKGLQTFPSWQISLASWSIPVFITLLAWIPQLKYKPEPLPAKKDAVKSRSLLKSALAWHITMFMGLQCTVFFIVLSWLPTILQSKGMDSTTSGWMLGFYLMLTLGAALILPFCLARCKDQRMLAVVFSIASAVPFAGLIFWPNLTIIWLFLTGIGGGAVGILAFSFISLRSKDYMQATSLSGMTQGFGYLIGACGPILFGLLFDLTQSWNLILLIIAALGIIQSYFGLKAGRNITLH